MGSETEMKKFKFKQIKVKTIQTNERNKQLFRWIIKELQFYYKLLVKIYQIQFSKLFKL